MKSSEKPLLKEVIILKYLNIKKSQNSMYNWVSSAHSYHLDYFFVDLVLKHLTLPLWTMMCRVTLLWRLLFFRCKFLKNEHIFSALSISLVFFSLLGLKMSLSVLRLNRYQ